MITILKTYVAVEITYNKILVELFAEDIKVDYEKFNPLDTLLSSSKKERISMKIKSRAD